MMCNSRPPLRKIGFRVATASTSKTPPASAIGCPLEKRSRVPACRASTGSEQIQAGSCTPGRVNYCAVQASKAVKPRPRSRLRAVNVMCSCLCTRQRPGHLVLPWQPCYFQRPGQLEQNGPPEQAVRSVSTERTVFLLHCYRSLVLPLFSFSLSLPLESRLSLHSFEHSVPSGAVDPHIGIRPLS